VTGDAVLPAFFFRQQVGHIQVMILRAVVISMRLASTNGAGDMIMLAAGLTLRKADFAWFDPNSAVRSVAVNSLADGDFPLRRPVVKSLLKIVGNIS
jgi:hypothetical protein